MTSRQAKDNDDNNIEMKDGNHTDKKLLLSDAELDKDYPDHPRNTKPTLPFHELITHLFDPLNQAREKPKGPTGAARGRAKVGPHGPSKRSPQEERRLIVEHFVSRWRTQVGPDLYPAFRLIIPEKDRDRAMYGLKEKNIGKLLVKVMRISRESEDGQALSNWKLPGKTAASRMAGDFAGRCFEVLSKRPIRTQLGDMTVGEVNGLLDKLSAASLEKDQAPIVQQFYSRMNPTELMWLIRMILRQMKVGASERTIFSIFHPDAEALFSVSSSLRRICWTLWDPESRLDDDGKGITVMQCYQPQLAQFQMYSFEKIVARLRPTEEDREFWVEEKLDGERMQMHMVSDPDVRGGKRFNWWSRKAKDYTYLYGNGLADDSASLTRFLAKAFHEGVESIILDGEMITWDPQQDAMVPFGSLKTAALDQGKNPYSHTGNRPFYNIFDVLYLNGKALTNYTLRDRRRALEASVKSVSRRFEIHPYQIKSSAKEIEPILLKVIEDASEGLVLKNPRSSYSLNDRNDDWMKVKPEYMEEFGEQLDCVIVGGYYGSGRRGGTMSSYLCGLIVKRDNSNEDLQSQPPSQPRSQSQSQSQSAAANPQRTYSFFKVGGGFKADDYAQIRHKTDGKWHTWETNRPPRDWIELAGGELQYEKPDMWIKPEDSVVLQVKAASIWTSPQFRMGLTLRFPRFVKLRADKDWTTALSVQELFDLDKEVRQKSLEKQENKLQVDESRRKRLKRGESKKIKMEGGTIDDVVAPYAGPVTKLFEGLNFYIISECVSPRKTKPEIEQIVKSNGGVIWQAHDARPDTICVADKRHIRAVSLEKRGDLNIIRPKWIFDCIKQSEVDISKSPLLLPLEPGHMWFAKQGDIDAVSKNADEFGDSYELDVTPDELRTVFANMKAPDVQSIDDDAVRQQLEEHGHSLKDLKGWMLESVNVYFDTASAGVEQSKSDKIHMELARSIARFAGANILHDMSDLNITHVVSERDKDRLKDLRRKLAERRKMPRIVSPAWVLQSWDEGTQLDEESFAMK